MGVFSGSLANAIAIVLGSLIGLALRTGIKERFETLIMDIMAFIVILIGLISSLKTTNFLLLILSLVIGSLLGEALQLESRLHALAGKIENHLLSNKTAGHDQRFSLGFIQATLVFCIGSMAIIGSLESGLAGKHDTLLAKSLLDGIVSVIFAASLGPGVLFSFVPVLLYEGLLTWGASALSSLMTASMLQEFSAVGGILIIGLGVNMTKLKKIAVVNMLPSLLIALIWLLIGK